MTASLLKPDGSIKLTLSRVVQQEFFFSQHLRTLQQDSVKAISNSSNSKGLPESPHAVFSLGRMILHVSRLESSTGFQEFQEATCILPIPFSITMAYPFKSCKEENTFAHN